ncbi:MAG: CHAD domain-containing protein [Micropruina sp.]|uniref:CHAD domain-containing protein n=1 Tax=Micropruina sp. TaxID=2737536 RepID=UPI0039E69655
MSTAAGIVIDYLRTQAEVIASRADDVAADAPDAVHRSRVATRRSRSALRTFASLFKRKQVRALRAELAWHADHLGGPRDAEVLKERLLTALDTLPGDDEAGPVAERLSAALDESHARAHAALVESMQTERYPQLRDRLARFVDDPPVRGSARAAGVDALPGLLERAVRRVGRLTERAAETDDDPHRWHEVRKAAKAARYCSEALIPAFGDPAKTLAEAWEEVTEALGEFQDTVVAEAYLATAAVHASEAGESPSGYLALIALELRQRDEALQRGRSALAAARAVPLPERSAATG